MGGPDPRHRALGSGCRCDGGFARFGTSVPTNAFSPLLGQTLRGTLMTAFSILVYGVEQKGQDMAIELISGAHFRRVLHHLSSRTRLEGSWAQVWPENDRKYLDGS